MVRVSGRGVLVVALAAVVGLAGCAGSAPGAAPSAGVSGSGSSARPSARPASWAPVLPGSACQAQMPGGTPVWFGADAAARLGGVVLGDGTTGVLLAHERRQTLCAWASYATELAGAGYRVLAVDLPGNGSSRAAASVPLDDAVVAGIALLRAQGVQRVLLVGASMGGTAVLAAAAKATPPVAGVVSLSAPQRFNGIDALAAAPRLGTPVLYVACRSDSGFAQAAEALHAATPAGTGNRLLVGECAGHGVETLSVAAIGPEVARFLRATAG